MAKVDEKGIEVKELKKAREKVLKNLTAIQKNVSALVRVHHGVLFSVLFLHCLFGINRNPNWSNYALSALISSSVAVLKRSDCPYCVAAVAVVVANAVARDNKLTLLTTRRTKQLKRVLSNKLSRSCMYSFFICSIC